MGVFNMLALIILTVAVASWSDSMAIAVGFFTIAFLFFTPVTAPVNGQRKGGVSLWTVAFCLIGLAWLAGGDDE
jgi:hypothetical protein